MTFPIAPTTSDARTAMIRAGVLRPGSRPERGDPTPQGWTDAPTLTLDALGKLAAERHRHERAEPLRGPYEGP